MIRSLAIDHIARGLIRVMFAMMWKWGGWSKTSREHLACLGILIFGQCWTNLNSVNNHAYSSFFLPRFVFHGWCAILETFGWVHSLLHSNQLLMFYLIHKNHSFCQLQVLLKMQQILPALCPVFRILQDLSEARQQLWQRRHRAAWRCRRSCGRMSWISG